jgi:hypothetical protein
MVKSPNTIQHFHKSFGGKADRRGIAPPVHNEAYSCSAKKKNKKPLFDHAYKTSLCCFNLFQFLLVMWLKISYSKFHKTFTVK